MFDTKTLVLTRYKLYSITGTVLFNSVDEPDQDSSKSLYLDLQHCCTNKYDTVMLLNGSESKALATIARINMTPFPSKDDRRRSPQYLG
jgi:hypothetical protein